MSIPRPLKCSKSDSDKTFSLKSLRTSTSKESNKPPEEKPRERGEEIRKETTEDPDNHAKEAKEPREVREGKGETETKRNRPQNNKADKTRTETRKTKGKAGGEAEEKTEKDKIEIICSHLQIYLIYYQSLTDISS